MLPTYISAGLGLVGAAQGLFGKSNNSAYKTDQGNANNNADQLGDIKNWYQTQATDQSKFYNADNADARTGLANLGNYLQTDPNNDSAYARDLARADDGLHANIAKMTLQNAAQGAESGVPGAAPSSTSTGVGAYLGALDALGTSANQVNVANTNQQRRQANLTDYYNLYNGAAGQDYGNANTSTGNEAGISGQLMNYYQQNAKQDQAVAQQGDEATAGGLGDLQGIFQMLSGGAGGKPAAVGKGPQPTINGVWGGQKSPVGAWGY